MKLVQALRVRPREVVSLVGAGGKTTIMLRLADELAARGQRVVITTTTHLYAWQAAQAKAHILYLPCQPLQVLTDRLAEHLDRHSYCAVSGPLDPDMDKVSGVPTELIEALTASSYVDVVLVEADGARGRSLKAPAEHEPVVPACTTLLVPVVGVDVLGRPLTNGYVHRPERVAQLAGVATGTPISPQIVASVLTHPQGGCKGWRPGMRLLPFINKVERAPSGHSCDALTQACQLADHLLACAWIEAAAIGAVQLPDPVWQVRGRVGAVVLAAGAASRYGALKQLLPWGSGTLLSQVVDTALSSQADPVVVVLGHQSEMCRAALGNRAVTVAINSEWKQGQSSSVRAGLTALRPDVQAALFLLADQPRVKVATLDALIERHRTTLAPVVWPEYAGRRGNPVLFDRSLFPELSRLSEDVGGRVVLASYAAYAERVPVDDPGILFDIDTPDDYVGADQSG